MNKTPDSIEVSRTRLFDCRRVIYFNLSTIGLACVLYAITSHLSLRALVVFIIIGIIFGSGSLIYLRTPYRFDFKNGNVIIYYRFYGKEKEKVIPYENFCFTKKLWHQNNDKGYSVSYLDIRKKTFYSLCMPELTEMNHWDEEALDYLLSLAEKNGVTVNTWDYPIRWGR